MYVCIVCMYVGENGVGSNNFDILSGCVKTIRDKETNNIANESLFIAYYSYYTCYVTELNI